MGLFHQVIYNIILNKNLNKKQFDYINQWSETLAYISFPIRASYQHTLKATPGQTVLGRYLLFNTTRIIYWKVIIKRKHRNVDIDNALKNPTQVRHD